MIPQLFHHVRPITSPMDRSFWCFVVLLPLVFFGFELTEIDIWLQDHFYNFQTREWWVDAHASLPRLLFYTGPKAVIWLIGLSMFAAAILHGSIPNPKFSRPDILVAVLTIATAPSLVALGKATTNTFTPSQIRRYGGDAPYVKVIEAYADNDRPTKRGRGFPAGHASGGFALLSLAGLASTRRGRAAGIAIGLACGTAMGTYQMLKGAHYLSHTVFTALLCWIVFLFWRRLILPRFGIDVSCGQVAASEVRHGLE